MHYRYHDGGNDSSQQSEQDEINFQSPGSFHPQGQTIYQRFVKLVFDAGNEMSQFGDQSNQAVPELAIEPV